MTFSSFLFFPPLSFWPPFLPYFPLWIFLKKSCDHLSCNIQFGLYDWPSSFSLPKRKITCCLLKILDQTNICRRKFQLIFLLGTENGESHFFVFSHFFFYKYSDCLSALYSLISSHWSTEKSAGPVAGSREETFIRSYIYILV